MKFYTKKILIRFSNKNKKNYKFQFLAINIIYNGSKYFHNLNKKNKFK